MNNQQYHRWSFGIEVQKIMNLHQVHNLPIIVGGGAGFGIKGDRHIHCSDGTPLANLWLKQAQLMGVKDNRFADSTQAMDQLIG